MRTASNVACSNLSQGTDSFKAVEILLGKHCFLPDEEDNFDSDDDSDEVSIKIVKRPLLELRYNPLHDLEALWWIGTHFVVTRAVTPQAEWSEEDQLYRQKHAQLASEMFGCGRKRSLVMTFVVYFMNKMEDLHPALHEVVLALRQTRVAIVRAYKKAEKDVSTLDWHAADGLHEVLRDRFTAIAKKFEEDDIRMEPVSYR